MSMRSSRPAEAPAEPKHQSKKNTRKWCKGKIGIEHQVEWIKADKLHASDTPQDRERLKRQEQMRKDNPGDRYKLYIPPDVAVCRICGKHLEWKWEDDARR